MPQTGPTASLTQAQRTALSDNALIDAAIALIIERGTEGATLKALGETAGYSRGLVTYRFGNKAGLFKAVLKSVSERWLDVVESAVNGLDGLPAVIACADAYLKYVRRSPRDVRAMHVLQHLAVEPGSELRGLVRKAFRAQRDQLAEWIRSGQTGGSINPEICADTYAAQFCAYTNGMTWAWMLNSRDIDWDRAHRDFKQRLTDDLTRGADAPQQPEIPA